MANSNKTKELTKKDYFNMLLEIDTVKNDEKLVAFINRELELLTKKSNRVDEKKVAAQNIAKYIVLGALKSLGKPSTVTEILNSDYAGIKDYTNQKITNVLQSLMKEGLVGRTVEKKVARYEAYEEEETISDAEDVTE